MMVATAALQEVQAKRSTLRTTIDNVLPGLWPGRGRVTLQQLLSHTSGMPWRFRPGEGYYDSNTGFVVAGTMLERARRTRPEELLRDRVFSKAGMNQSRLYNSGHVDSPELEDYFLEGPRKERLEKMNMSIFPGSGGVTATSADITDFWAVLLRGQLISNASVSKMITPVGAVKEAGYGYGVQVMDDVFTGMGVLYGHSGGGFGSTAMALSSRDGRRRMTYMMTAAPTTRRGTCRWPRGSTPSWTLPSRSPPIVRARLPGTTVRPLAVRRCPSLSSPGSASADQPPARGPGRTVVRALGRAPGGRGSGVWARGRGWRGSDGQRDGTQLRRQSPALPVRSPR